MDNYQIQRHFKIPKYLYNEIGSTRYFYPCPWSQLYYDLWNKLLYVNLNIKQSFRHPVYRKHGKHVLPDSADNYMDNDNDMDNMENYLQPRADIPPSMDALKSYKSYRLSKKKLYGINFYFVILKQKYGTVNIYHLK